MATRIIFHSGLKLNSYENIVLKIEMSPTGTPEQQTGESSTWSINVGGANVKRILEVRGIPCFDPKGEPSSQSVR